MAKHLVRITETTVTVVMVDAGNREEAEAIAQEYHGDYGLDDARNPYYESEYEDITSQWGDKAGEDLVDIVIDRETSEELLRLASMPHKLIRNHRRESKPADISVYGGGGAR